MEHTSQDPGPEGKDRPDWFADAYPALHRLLSTANSALGGERACLITPDTGPDCSIIAASDMHSGPTDPAPYRPAATDLTADVRYGDQMLGRLVVTNPRPDVQPEQLTMFAEVAGFVLWHGRQLAESARLIEESRVMRELGLQLGEPEHLEQLLAAIVKGARRLLHADYASVATLNADGTTRWRAVDGFRTDVYRHIVFDPGRGSAGRAITGGQPVALEGIGTSPDLPADEFPVHRAEGGVSALAVPMMVGRRAIGALILGSRTPRHWTESETKTALVLANNAALAIEQARASAAEYAQRAFLERVIEHFPGPLVVLEPPDYRVLLANTGFMRLLSEPYRSGTSVVGRTVREIVRQWTERTDAIMAVLEQVVATGTPRSFEQDASESADGGITYWNWSAVPIEGVGQEGQRVVMLVAYDVTEATQARNAAQQAARIARTHAEELEATIRHMADGVVIFDARGHIKKMNPAAEWLAGRAALYSMDPARYPNEYGLYTLSGERVAVEDLPAMRALKGETVVGQQGVIRKPDGKEVIVSVSASPITDADGRIVGAVGVFHDITQEKLAERLKDEFLSVVSHELRTPLSAIMGYSDLMLRGVHGALTERQAKALNAVRANADRLLHLINDLLDVSRLEAGTVTINPEAVDIGEVVSKAITQTRVLAVKAGVAVENRLALYHLPRVYADATKLHQIIENLLTNAIKFTPSGGRVIFTASLSPLPASDPSIRQHPALPVGEGESEGEGAAGPGQGFAPQSLILTVSDTGVGLEPDQLERIWDRFYQVDSSVKRRTGGVGLGLAIVRNLVELHGGQVWATSAGINMGSNFSFSLPLASTEPVRPTRRVRRSRTGQDAEYHAIGTVLVAEDDEDQREIICRMLELEGYRVVLASDGIEALELASKVRPRAIALDIILPDTDGWEVLARLKSDPATRDIPVLIISVVDQKEFARNMGADEYLVKPLNPASLRQAVRRLVEGRGSTDSPNSTDSPPTPAKL